MKNETMTRAELEDHIATLRALSKQRRSTVMDRRMFAGHIATAKAALDAMSEADGATIH